MTTTYKTGGKRKSAHKKSANRKLKGGNGGADYAIATYGGIGQQHSANNSNVIAMNPAPAYVAEKLAGGSAVLSPLPLNGGRKKKGGNILTDVAVPAVLLVANHMYKRKPATLRYRGSRKSRRNFSRKVRGGTGSGSETKTY